MAMRPLPRHIEAVDDLTAGYLRNMTGRRRLEIMWDMMSFTRKSIAQFLKNPPS